MRIYVASLSDYNAGRLHGAWIDVTSVEEMEEQIQEMLSKSTEAVAEEWAIHDHEDFKPYSVSEHESLANLEALANGVEEHGEAFLDWAANSPSNLESPERFQDEYRGEYESLAAYVEECWSECGTEAPQGQWWHPLNYVDWERMAHDLEVSGDVWTADSPNGVYVFAN